MKNTNKKSIVFSLKILATLAFALIFVPFCKASAVGYVYGGLILNYSNNNQNTNYYQPPAPTYVPPPSPIYYNYNTNPAPTSTPIVYSSTTAKKTNTTKTVAKANTSKTSTSTASTTTSSTNNSSDNKYNGLAANAFYGSNNSFLPSGLIQWILFAIVILLIVILARKVFGAEENYHTAPMKHD